MYNNNLKNSARKDEIIKTRERYCIIPSILLLVSIGIVTFTTSINFIITLTLICGLISCFSLYNIIKLNCEEKKLEIADLVCDKIKIVDKKIDVN